MLKLDESEIPKKIIEFEKVILSDFLSKLKSKTIIYLEQTSEKKKIDSQKTLKNCLLLINFLLGEKTQFNEGLTNLKLEELKVSEKNQLHFDLQLLHSTISTKSKILNKVTYDKLMKTYRKWSLLIPNLLENRYERQLQNLSKLDWKITPSQLFILLDLLTDWFYRLQNKEIFLNSIKNKIDQIEKDKKINSELNELNLAKLKKPLSIVKVAVWDTGVDEKVIKNVSSNTALFYDKDGEPTQEKMMPLKDINENGLRTDFTTIGKNVQLYANGSYVKTILPRGYTSKSSGTSIAAPQVSNLAATMLSICPRLEPIMIKEMLVENADKMLDENILVLNPKRTIQETMKLN